MKAEQAIKIIDQLLEDKNKNNYFVDFVPFTFKNEDYFELEEFLDNHFKNNFADKIVFIAFSIMYFYKSSVYIDEEFNPSLRNKDLRNIGLEKLNKIIHKMINQNYQGLSILFKNSEKKFSLMRIEDGYSVYFFNILDKDYEIIKELIEHQGLFLKRITDSTL